MNRIPPTLSFLIGAGLISLILFADLRESLGDKTRDYDFVEITEERDGIIVELPYATRQNFTETQLYQVERCFLRPEVAERLRAVQQTLSRREKPLVLKIWDGYRPHSVQYVMWEKSPLPGFVGNPKRGSRHNRGAAVDVTLVDPETGRELDMGTAFDAFTEKAAAHYTRLPAEVLQNRKILQDAMTSHGFQIMRTEWWHFDAVRWWEFPLADTPIRELAARVPAE